MAGRRAPRGWKLSPFCSILGARRVPEGLNSLQDNDMRRSFAGLAAALCALLAAGCMPPSGGAAGAPDPELYQPHAPVVTPGDQVVLRAYREGGLGDTLVVDAGGVLRIPRFGPLTVAGMSAVAVQDSVRAALGAYIRNPSIDVRVLLRVGVQGAVQEPDLYLVDVNATLRDVIAQAGGVAEAGNPADVRLIRDGRVLRVDGGRNAPFRPVLLRSGDQVVVGRRSWLERNALTAVGTLAAVLSTVVLLLNSAGNDSGN